MFIAFLRIEAWQGGGYNIEIFAAWLEYQDVFVCSAISNLLILMVVVFHIMQVNLFSK